MSIKAAITGTFIRSMALVSQFIIVAITNRALSVDDRGIFAALTSWNSLFFTLGYMSIHLAIVTFANKVSVSELIGNSIIVGCILGVLTICIAWLCFLFFPSWYYNFSTHRFILIILPLPLIMIQNYHFSILQVKGYLKECNQLLLFNILINISITALLIILKAYNLRNGLIVLLIGFTINFSSTLLTLFKVTGWKIQYNKIGVLGLLSVGVIAHVSSIVTYINNKFDILALNYYVPSHNVAIYYLAVTICSTILFIPTSIQGVLYSMIQTHTQEQLQKNVIKVSRITFFFMTIIALSLVGASKIIVTILGGAKYQEACNLIPFLMPGVVFMSVPVILSTIWNSMGLFKFINYASILVLVTSLSLNVVLISHYGSKGAAITSTLSATLIFGVHLFFALKFTSIKNVFNVFIINKDDFKWIIGIVKNKYNHTFKGVLNVKE